MARIQTGNVGIFLASTKNTPGYYAMQAIAHDFDAIKDELGGSVFLDKGLWINDSLHVESLTSQRRASGRSPGLPSGLTPL